MFKSATYGEKGHMIIRPWVNIMFHKNCQVCANIVHYPVRKPTEILLKEFLEANGPEVLENVSMASRDFIVFLHSKGEHFYLGPAEYNTCGRYIATDVDRTIKIREDGWGANRPEITIQAHESPDTYYDTDFTGFADWIFSGLPKEFLKYIS